MNLWCEILQVTFQGHLMNRNSTLIMSFSLDSTLAPKFEARVYSSLQVESLGLDYTLASNLGARVELTLL